MFLLPLLFCMCSPSGDGVTPIVPASTFEITVTPSLNNIVVDQHFTVMVAANQSMKSIEMSTDNFVTKSGLQSDFGTSKELYFNFDELGSKTISIRAKNAANQVATKKITLNVMRGNAIKVTGLQVVSFSNINNTWDPEFPTTNPNHLADVYFGFSKSRLENFYTNEYYNRLWFTSPVKDNQGNLIWDITADNLYLNPNLSLQFGLVDKDGELGQDLLLGPPDYKTLNLSSYLSSKPSTITYSFPEINLEIKVSVEWAS